MASPAELQAAAVTGPLWAAITAVGGRRPTTRQHRHFPRAYDPGWMAALSLPTGAARPPGQPVALLDDRDEFDRHLGSGALDRAYARRPRTRVYEDINRDRGGAWYALAARHLGRPVSCELQVVSRR